MRNTKYEEKFFTETILASQNLSDAVRRLGLGNGHGNRQTISKYIKKYGIDISHFSFTRNTDGLNGFVRAKTVPLCDLMVEHSTYDGKHLKRRLYSEGLKRPICEKCGQDEWWNGEKISLILDHINGVHDDNRLKNLRIICPNCSATLETNGGKNRKIDKRQPSICECGKPKHVDSKCCWQCSNQRRVNNHPTRPELPVLLQDINNLGYNGAGRKYDVTDNAIRKWVKILNKTRV
jgi:hypothetical protein